MWYTYLPITSSRTRLFRRLLHCQSRKKRRLYPQRRIPIARFYFDITVLCGSQVPSSQEHNFWKDEMVEVIKWSSDAFKWRPNNGTLLELPTSSNEKNSYVGRLIYTPQDVRRVTGSGELMCTSPLQDMENFNNRLQSIQKRILWHTVQNRKCLYAWQWT